MAQTLVAVRQGGVQSVALRILCDRELTSKLCISEYWTIEGEFSEGKHTIRTQMVELMGQKLEKFSLPDEKHAKDAVKAAPACTLTSVQKKQVSRNPAAPFMTSTRFNKRPLANSDLVQRHHAPRAAAL